MRGIWWSCVTRWRARGQVERRSGRPAPGRHLLEVKRGRIVRVTLAYPDKAEALEAAGLSK